MRAGINRPTFDSNTEITMEEVFQVATAAPGMVSLEVAIVCPRVSCKNVGAPKSDVELCVPIPLRASSGATCLISLPE